MKRGILPLALTMAVVFTACSNYHLTRGNENYEKLNYHEAVHSYRKYLKNNEDPEVRLKLAESCIRINKFHEAFKELEDLRVNNDPDKYWLVKGRKYMQDGKYDSAEVAFKFYLDRHPKDVVADQLCKSCNWIYGKMQDTGYYEIRPIELKNFHNYFSATHYRNGIIFTASEANIKKAGTGGTAKDYNLYYLEKDSSGGYKEPVLLGGDVNGIYNETCPCINPKDGQLVFTRSAERKKLSREGAAENLRIFFADYKGDHWKDVREFPYNDQRYSVAHPSLSEKAQLFFFVSDKPGGMGGTDLYYSIMTAGGFSEPVNLGATINTPGNEMFPWYNEKDSSLYFSSEGHQNFGGLDIFRVRFNDGKPGVVENLGFPVNSSRDDYSYLLNEDGKTGYFSSNRGGNDKLYEVKVLPLKVTVTGMIRDEDQQALSGAVVEVVDKSTGEVRTLQSAADGSYSVQLEEGREYIVDAYHKECLRKAPFQLSTKGIVKHEVIDKDFTLESIELDKAVIIDQLYYDVNSWEVTEASQPELNKLVDLMKRNPDVIIEVSSHTDSRADDVFNTKLSAKRARSVMEYLVSNGIPESRILWRGYGESALLNHCANGVECSESEHALNRRTEFRVIGFKNDSSAVK